VDELEPTAQAIWNWVRDNETRDEPARATSSERKKRDRLLRRKNQQLSLHTGASRSVMHDST
jgi:hypothetical protein